MGPFNTGIVRKETLRPFSSVPPCEQAGASGEGSPRWPGRLLDFVL